MVNSSVSTELNSNLTKLNDSIATINNKLISIVERGVKNGYNYIKYSNGDAVVWRKYTWNTDVSVSCMDYILLLVKL